VDLGLGLGTTTGDDQPNLVVKPKRLTPGLDYTFKLTATYPGENPGVSTTKVAISTPPRGGRLIVENSATREVSTTGKANPSPSPNPSPNPSPSPNPNPSPSPSRRAPSR
jgi:hypothetical protein